MKIDFNFKNLPQPKKGLALICGPLGLIFLGILALKGNEVALGGILSVVTAIINDYFKKD